MSGLSLVEEKALSRFTRAQVNDFCDQESMVAALDVVAPSLLDATFHSVVTAGGTTLMAYQHAVMAVDEFTTAYFVDLPTAGSWTQPWALDVQRIYRESMLAKVSVLHTNTRVFHPMSAALTAPCPAVGLEAAYRLP